MGHMPGSTWSAVDWYITDLLVRPDEALQEATRKCQQAGLPHIAVSAPQGALLHLLVRISGARKVLEIGTLGGYSAIWIARGLPPGGKLISLEVEPRHAAIARENLRNAGVETVAEVRLGKALESLAAIARTNEGPFDLFFIDADKPNNTNYFEACLKLSRPGSIILVDNVVKDGLVLDERTLHPDIQGVRALNERMAREPGLVVTEIQTVGEKGYDGFALAVVGPPPAG
jgi:predicted O-methyltransferase YrrM